MMDFDFDDVLTLTTVMAPGFLSVWFFTDGDMRSGIISVLIAIVALLALVLPYVILAIRNPSDEQLFTLTRARHPYEVWGLACKRRQALIRFCANDIVFTTYYDGRGYERASAETYDWYGEDAIRVAAHVATLRAGMKDAGETLTMFAEAGVTDFDQMLAYLEHLEPEEALAAMKNDIPLEYAVAMSAYNDA